MGQKCVISPFMHNECIIHPHDSTPVAVLALFYHIIYVGNHMKIKPHLRTRHQVLHTTTK